MTTLYVAGPMRGIRHFNFEAFLNVAEQLRAAGYTVICPAERDMENGFDPVEQDLTGRESMDDLNFDLRKTLAWDLTKICREADGIALLSGWMDSRGARAEVATAEALGIEARLHHWWIDQAGKGLA